MTLPNISHLSRLAPLVLLGFSGCDLQQKQAVAQQMQAKDQTIAELQKKLADAQSAPAASSAPIDADKLADVIAKRLDEKSAAQGQEIKAKLDELLQAAKGGGSQAATTPGSGSAGAAQPAAPTARAEDTSERKTARMMNPGAGSSGGKAGLMNPGKSPEGREKIKLQTP